jgi:hypothetical protein
VRRYLVPVAHALGFLVALLIGYIVVIGEDPRALNSVRCSVGAMSITFMIGSAVSMGAGAVDSVDMVRSRTVVIFRSLPLRSIVKMAAQRILAIAMGGVTGLLTAVSGAIVVAMIHGSGFSWESLSRLPVQALGIVSSTSIGWMLGALIGSWLVPPLVTLASYAGFSFALGPAVGPVVMAMGAYPPVAAYIHPALPPYAATVALSICVVGCAFAALLAWIRPTYRAITSCGFAFAGVFILYLVLGATLSVARPFVGHEYDDPDDWICGEVAPGLGTLCMPPERPDDFMELREDIAPLATRLALLDPESANKTWLPYIDNSPNTLAYDLPLGSPFDFHLTAQGLVGSLMGRCNDLADREMLSLAWQAQEIITLWLDPEFPTGEPSQPEIPSDEQAQLAYAFIKSCQ